MTVDGNKLVGYGLLQRRFLPSLFSASFVFAWLLVVQCGTVWYSVGGGPEVQICDISTELWFALLYSALLCRVLLSVLCPDLEAFLAWTGHD